MNYELMLVVQGQIPEDLAKEVINKVKSTVQELNGKVELEEFWGRRKLSYKIGNQEHGYYDVINFTIEPDDVKRVENEIKLIGEVIRYLIVKKTEHVSIKKTKKKIEARKDKSKFEGVEKKEEREKKEEEPKEIEESKLKKEGIEEEKKLELEKEVKEQVKEEKKKDKKKEVKFQEKDRMEELDKKIDEILKE